MQCIHLYIANIIIVVDAVPIIIIEMNILCLTTCLLNAESNTRENKKTINIKYKS